MPGRVGPTAVEWSHVEVSESSLRRPTAGIKSIKFRYFFFFQAEDGIRDYKVTGVQTCALPILYADLLVRRLSEYGIRVTRAESNARYVYDQAAFQEYVRREPRGQRVAEAKFRVDRKSVV